MRSAEHLELNMFVSGSIEATQPGVKIYLEEGFIIDICNVHMHNIKEREFIMSPRPKKPRRCRCRFPGRAFKPTGTPMRALKKIELHEDELEAIRLCDLAGLSQEEAGRQLGVSRGTTQRLIKTARRKVARALIEGNVLIFDEKGESR